MKVEAYEYQKHPVEGMLEVDASRENKLFITHTNSDDPHYTYKYIVTGSEIELKIIKDFCNQLTILD